MRTTAFLAVIAIALPCVAAAQAGAAPAQPEMGLDLSKPPAEKEPAKKAEEKRPEEAPGLDLSKPPAAEKPADLARPKSEEQKKPAAASPLSAQDVALGDKVKAVQKKGFLKRGRFEIAPIFALSVNDAFQSQLLSSQLYRQAMVDGVWSPIYGKASFLEKSIVHFDVYLSAGFGLVWSATSFAPRNEGPHLATDFGGGVRFYPKSWLAFELGLLATLYNDQPILSVPGTIQKVFVANVGVSFFLPPSFDYVYP